MSVSISKALVSKNMAGILPLTSDEQYQILNHLNFSIYRQEPLRADYENYGGEFYRFNATLNPTEYRANRPKPLLFTISEITAAIASNTFDGAGQQIDGQITAIRTVLESLNTIETAIQTEKSSPNSALVKADVLEWNAGVRAAGMESRRDELINQMLMLLAFPPTPDQVGGAILWRS